MRGAPPPGHGRSQPVGAAFWLASMASPSSARKLEASASVCHCHRFPIVAQHRYNPRRRHKAIQIPRPGRLRATLCADPGRL